MTGIERQFTTDRQWVLVEVSTPYFKGRVWAVALENPICPLLIGNTVRFEGDVERDVSVQLPPQVTAAVVTRQQARREQEALKPVRQPVPVATALKVTPTEIKEMQAKDPETRKLARLQGQAAKATKKGQVKFESRKGILHREYTSDSTRYRQLVVPSCLRSSVLRVGHDHPMSGHLGTKRTLERIQKDFYWPGIASDVKRYCRSCDVCQRTVPRGYNMRVPLGSVPLVATPFAKVGVDLIGPIVPTSTRGYKYILVMVDYATRYPEAVPLRRIDAITVAEALWEMWTRTGIPETIISDQGTQFVSEVMREVYHLLDIHKETTSPYHAQANGLVERFNATLKRMLKRLCLEKPKDWDQYIPGVLFAYREVPQESLRFSPFELLYGRTVRGPLTLLRQKWTEESTEGEVQSEVEYVLDLKERIQSTCRLAQEHLSKAQQRYKTQYDRRAKARWYQPGDEVLLLLPVKKNKLQLAWQGPFPVVERVGDWDYRVRVKGKDKLVHANLIKGYVRREGVAAGFTPVVVESHVPAIDDPQIPLIPLQAEESWKDVKISTKLPAVQQEELRTLCERFQDILTDLPLRCNVGECTLSVTQSEPVAVKQYPLPHSQAGVIKKEVESMLQMGVIERAQSPYSSPILLVRKPDGSFRFCVDFRRFNRVLRFDGEPMPDVEHLFAQVGSAKYFSKLDLTKGYWQIPMREADKHMTAFTTPQGQFQWLVMPFGLKTAGAVFSRTMRMVLDVVKQEGIYNFIDDVLIASEDWQSHVKALTAVFSRLREVQLAARPSKCQLGESKVGFLGHVLDTGRILPEADKLGKIDQATPPTTKKELRSFLGLIGYYRRFVPNFAEKAKPLTDRTQAKQPEKVRWDEQGRQAFEQLKAELVRRPILRLPQPGKPFVLRTDASGTGIGAALMQEHEGDLHPVMFASRKLSEAESRYHTIEQECWAVVWAIRKFYPYLYGREFVLESDHHPLQYLHRIRPVSRRLMGWAVELQSTPFSFRHITGPTNVEADYLSRMTV